MRDFPNPIKQNEPENIGFENGEKASGAKFDDVDLSVLTAFEDAQCAGEPDLIVELIDLYLDDAPKQLSAMKDSISRADRIALQRAAHTLKGSSANLGVNRIAALCREIEQTDFGASFRAARDLTNRLERAFARVRAVFLAERQSRV